MKKETTISIMHLGFISMLAMCAVMFSSCSSDSDVVNGDDGNNPTGEPELIATAHSKEMVEETTRSSFSFNQSTKGMTFKWDGSDKLTVFAEDNYQAKQIYNIVQREGEYSQSAHFSSQDFMLTVDKRYFALSKAEGNHPGGEGTSIPDQKNIIVDYSGQKQDGNGNPAHLGNYDFMATSAVCKEKNQIHFDFKHIGATLRLKVRPSEASDPVYSNVKFTKAEIYSADNSFRQPLRVFDLSKGVQPDGSYIPAYNEPDMTGDVKRFTLDLYTGEEPGIKPASEFNDGTDASYNNLYNLILYMEVPAANLSATSVGLILYGKNESDQDIIYYATRSGFNIEAGKAYNVPFVAKQTTNYTVSLKVNHNWQHGATETRATGDPGYDKEFNVPRHLYYFFCVDNKVRAVKDFTGTGSDNPYNHIAVTGTDDDKWTTDKTTGISTYGKKLTFPTMDEDKGNKKQLFVIASDTELPAGTFTGIENGDDVSEVLALTYSISNPSNQEVSQAFLRDLYSTPWVSAEAPFVGDLTDPIQDVFLYHVAAKVDLKWNNDNGLNPATDKIKVTGVMSTGLSLFQPTTNSGSGTYDVSTDVTKKTWYNGRQVYYLPQFSNHQYDVTIGTQNYSSYDFRETTTTGGFTSWLRALIMQ